MAREDCKHTVKHPDGKYTGHLAPVWYFVDFNVLNADKQITAVERHWIMKGAAELNQSICLRAVLASEWKLGNALHQEEVILLITQETKHYDSLKT